MDKNELDIKITDAAKSILSYCISRTPNRNEAEDLAQDIIVEIYRSAANIRNSEAFYGFMWKVASNVYKQWCKKKSKNREESLPENIFDDTDIFDNEDSDLYLLRRELTLLNEKYRKATILYYINNLSCLEISKKLSVSESMVKYLLFKSRQKLKEGIIMERKLGNLSYNPKSFTPLYLGSGPNRWWEFMGSKVRQNIVLACFNDSLTAEQISLETGIPLPYLDDEINALVEKNILLKDGSHYKTNVIIITEECFNETERESVKTYSKIADSISEFITKYYEKFKSIGFSGSYFSENTLRWQLLAMIFRGVLSKSSKIHGEMPTCPWGGNAYMWLTESSVNEKHLFNFSVESDNNGNQIMFLDYLPKLKGDHHDFYGNTRLVSILCDIIRGEADKFDEYDLEAVAYMIKQGYVLKNEKEYSVAMPVFTKSQYGDICSDVDKFIEDELMSFVNEIENILIKRLHEYTPKYLHKQIDGIVCVSKVSWTIYAPANILIQKGFVHTAWISYEMPSTCVVLGE